MTKTPDIMYEKVAIAPDISRAKASDGGVIHFK